MTSCRDGSMRSSRPTRLDAVGLLGVVAFLASVPGEIYPTRIGIVAALAIWIVGATIVNLFTR